MLPARLGTGSMSIVREHVSGLAPTKHWPGWLRVSLRTLGVS